MQQSLSGRVADDLLGVRLLSFVLLDFLFVLFHADGNRCDDTDRGKPACHDPVTSGMTEALHKHHRDCGQCKPERDDEGNGYRRSGNVLDDNAAHRRLGVIDQACKHRPAPFD